jgi:uracil-DNA glycosylase
MHDKNRSSDIQIRELLDKVRACSLCDDLALGPRPVVQIGSTAKLLIIGQAPGTRVHNTGIPWNDPSGDKLREWLDLDRETFYDPAKIAIMPMGFCYPGRGKGGDLPPKSICAPTWHDPLLGHLPNLELVLLLGQYAQKYYLGKGSTNVAETIRKHDYRNDKFLPLVHPSPRNRRWLANHSWFEAEVVPVLRGRVHQLLNPS